ncbi:PAS domain S-box protein [Microcoleus sp. ZQ-A2]|nr:PAS domain S-box protein [Microcoleus sp. FACHB-1]
MHFHSTSPELPHSSINDPEAKKLLQDSEARFRTLVENIPGAVYRCTYDEQFQGLSLRTMVFLSEAIQAVSGYPPSDFMNNRVRSFTSIIHPQDRAWVDQAIRQSISTKQPYVLEYRIVKANGSLVWVYDKGQGISDENGKILWLDGVILDITERKQTEADLRYSQTFLNSILDNLPVAVFIKEVDDLRVMYWNKASEELFGYSREEVLGKNDYDFLPQEQARYFRAKDRQVLAGGERVDRLEVPINTPHRGERFVSTKRVSLFDENGSPRYLLGICEDMTERKPGEKALRESEARYRSIVETATEGVWIFDADSQTTFANSRMLQMLGYTMEEMLGRSLFDFMDEESRAIASAYIERRRQGIQERHDFKFRRKDGSDLWALVSATPILDSTGQFVGVLRMITDISDRKRVEKALRESEQRFRATFDQAAVGIAHVGLEGKFLRINQKFCDLVGYTQEEMLTRSFQNITHPDDLEVHLTYLDQMLSGEIQTYSLEKRYMTRTGEIVWVNLTVSLRRRSSGEPKYFIKVVQDISAIYKELRLREQAEAALRQSESRLRAKNQQLKQTLHQLKQTQAQLIQNEKMVSLGQLVAGIAHEINNPVSFIYGNISYAHQYADDLLRLLQLYAKHYPQLVPEIQNEIEALDLNFLKADFPKLLNSIKAGANRIRQIVLSLRNFSRLDEAGLKPVDLHEGLDNTLLILQHRLKGWVGKPEIEVRKEYGQLPLVECYAGALNQVFMNLLNNAIDALEPQPSPRIITIRTSVEIGHWVKSKVKNQKSKGSSKAEPGNPGEVFSNISQDGYPAAPGSPAQGEASPRSNCPSPLTPISTGEPTRRGDECPNPQFVVIRIADNGPGIPLAVKTQIFDPFFTTKPVGVGTGLGLAIAYSIVVEQHRGHLTCISKPGQGAEFVIELPIRQHNLSTATSVESASLA